MIRFIGTLVILISIQVFCYSSVPMNCIWFIYYNDSFTELLYTVRDIPYPNNQDYRDLSRLDSCFFSFCSSSKNYYALIF